MQGFSRWTLPFPLTWHHSAVRGLSVCSRVAACCQLPRAQHFFSLSPSCWAAAALFAETLKSYETDFTDGYSCSRSPECLSCLGANHLCSVSRAHIWTWDVLLLQTSSKQCLNLETYVMSRLDQVNDLVLNQVTDAADQIVLLVLSCGRF